jgi:DNA-binding MarR family transcriptional regulator
MPPKARSKARTNAPTDAEPSVSPAERRAFEALRDGATLQHLFKASRLVNERALATAASDQVRPPVRAAHTALFPHLDFEGIRLTDLAARVGVTKQAVGQLVDDLVALGMVERVADPTDNRAKRVRFSRRGHAALMHGIGVLRDLEESLAAQIGRRRMREFHETLKLIIAALEGGAAPPVNAA